MNALMIVDMQNDFMEGGSLAVPGARHLVPIIQHLAPLYSICIGSLDWHPCDHVSFRDFAPANAEETAASDRVAKWPRHCIAFTAGAMPACGIGSLALQFFPKGTERLQEEFSCIRESPGTASPCRELLRQHGVTDVDVVGVALDYCVGATAVDLVRTGLRVRVLIDAVGAVTQDIPTVSKRLAEQGVQLG